MKRLKEWGPLIAPEQQVDDGDRRIEDRRVGLDQPVNGLAERIARIEGLLSARAVEPEPPSIKSWRA